ncbi:hypothetical protein NUU61_009485 [Penicillium alfredii]|uniref:Uncharacterized protein n=1 Tax=Penicillium alfredii TaxID=1506179 RepID=A0A9W9EN92_9EURO|nr:uncharacterized protein NUU61_009485 [Penicillium alfredii]KAJ5084906.1 hypothetical protein NUU61_009485 [Penicillium alfredii]
MKAAIFLALLRGLHSFVSATVDGSNSQLPSDNPSFSDDARSLDSVALLENRADSDDSGGVACGPATVGVIEPRSFNDIFDDFGNSSSLTRRTITLPKRRTKKAMDAYIQGQLVPHKSHRIIWRKNVDVGNGQFQVEDMATSLFKPLDDEAFSLGTNHLSGCTVLVIVSRKGVYMAHYWESISFVPENDWRRHFGSNEKCFTETVLRGLRQGVHEEGAETAEQVPLTWFANYFDDDTTVAYIMRPEKDAWYQTAKRWENQYLPKWKEIKKVVGEIVPRLQNEAKWKEIVYNRLDREDSRLDTEARGIVLYQFDPDNRYYSAKLKGTATQKKSLLWAEDSPDPRHEDTWDDGPVKSSGRGKGG